MIVSFSDAARVEQLFTDNRRELQRQLSADPAHESRDGLGRGAARGRRAGQSRAAAFEISETQVAEGLPATLYIFSDGKFPDVRSDFRWAI